MSAAAIADVLSRPLPEDANARIALVAFRRIVGHGLHDAGAVRLALDSFGPAFQRPLALLRVLATDLSATTTMRLAVAPCCCGRMTATEAALLAILARVEREPEAARLLMADVLGTRAVDGPLAIAAGVAAAFADAGRPIG